MNIHTCLCVGTLVVIGFTFIYICTGETACGVRQNMNRTIQKEPLTHAESTQRKVLLVGGTGGEGGGVLTLAQSSAQQLVSLWANTRELAGFVDTLELAEVTGIAALVNVCQVTFRIYSLLIISADSKHTQFPAERHAWIILHISYRYKQSRQAPARSPARIDRGRCRMCCNTSESREPPCHTHSHLQEWMHRGSHIYSVSSDEDQELLELQLTKHPANSLRGRKSNIRMGIRFSCQECRHVL